MSKLRISKKQAKELADLINSCTVWASMAEKTLLEGGDSQKVRRYMTRHDKSATELNALLGTVAVHTYVREAS